MFLLPGVRPTDARQTFLNDDLPFLHRLLLMPMPEEEANVAYNFVHSLFNRDTHQKVALETTLISAFQTNAL
jgi:hypothetical protein